MTNSGDCVDCVKARERLEAYVDRELSDLDLVQVRRHLADCPDCERCFEYQGEVKMLVRRKGCPELAPPHLLGRILTSLTEA
ncbi:MAG: zf-HC2 domain-containing protein [Candidatus Dormibacteria bacterium]